MSQRNEDIRTAKGNIPNWIIAEKLGVHEVTFLRWMRQEMSQSKKQKVFTAIYKVKNEMKEAGE